MDVFMCKAEYATDEEIKKIQDEAKSRGLYAEVYGIKMPKNEPFLVRETTEYDKSLED